jgi:dihydroflavonol-4-reductase
MKVLVTGGTGFIGSWLVRALADKGYEVTLLHRASDSPSELAPFVARAVQGDVTDFESLKPAMDGTEVVFHLAGVVGYDPRQRALMEAVNVDGTKNVLEAALEKGVGRFIHLSSVVAVGASFNPKKILDESSSYELSHLNMGYFETKRKAEELVLQAVKNHNLEALCLNPATVYGPGDALKGSRSVQVKVAQGKMSVYPPGGVNIVHIQDVIDCLLKAVNTGQKGERYILAGENLLLRDVFAKIADIAGVRAPSIKLPKSLVLTIGFIGDQMNRLGLKGPLTSENAWAACLYHWFDSTKAQQTFQFTPKSADLALKESVQWMKDHGLIG